MMIEAIKYLKRLFGQDIQAERLEREQKQKLPLFIAEAYDFYSIRLYARNVVMIQLKEHEDFTITQIEKHLNRLWTVFGTVILAFPTISAYTRKRLIEKRINFIVPEKQLFLPDLLIDLQENFIAYEPRKRSEKLLPSAQFILLFHLLSSKDNDWKLEHHSFKEIAKRLGYTAMGVTKAIENLKQHKVVNVFGGKEKYLEFKLDGAELWHYIDSRKLWTDPVLKKVYSDVYPHATVLLSNESALAEYSNMNPSHQLYYAIGRNDFYGLENRDEFVEDSGQDRKYCFEVWKYDPRMLSSRTHDNTAVIDPLSLYLSLRNIKDERIEMALEQILERYLW